MSSKNLPYPFSSLIFSHFLTLEGPETTIGKMQEKTQITRWGKRESATAPLSPWWQGQIGTEREVGEILTLENEHETIMGIEN